LPVIAAPPPPAPALEVTAPVQSARAWLGVGNPEHVHAGGQFRWSHWAATVSVGTLGLSHSVSGSLRYFTPVGGYVEAGTTWLRLAPLSAHTPGDFFPLGHWNVGWQWSLSRWLLDVAVGPPPFHLMNSSIVPLNVLNATALPRLRLGVAYAF